MRCTLVGPRSSRGGRAALAGAVLAVVLTGAAAGCGSSGDPSPQVGSSRTVGVAGSQGFCAVFARLGGDRPREYVGSPQHLRDLEALGEAVPGDLRDDVEVIHRFVASGEMGDRPEDALTASWPPEVQEAVLAVRAEAVSGC